VFARPYGYEEEAKELVWRVLRERTEAAGIPVLADMDLGHADPMLTLPLGCPARVDARAPSFELLEPTTAG
jgi:muramoyltetrapeptide carboxypeptidase LdcA involved in peptidoglycan recycling